MCVTPSSIGISDGSRLSACDCAGAVAALESVQIAPCQPVGSRGPNPGEVMRYGINLNWVRQLMALVVISLF
jgi:hypothetical protein